MAKKSKIAGFSKKEIAHRLSSSENYNSEETKSMVDSLKKRAMAGQRLSVSESDCICRWLRQEELRGMKNAVDIRSIPACKDFLFKDLYLSYHGDLEGVGEIRNFENDMLGKGPLTQDQKKRDVAFLNDEYLEWKTKLSIYNHKGDQLLNAAASEANDERKEAEKKPEYRNLSKEEIEAANKSRVFNARYTYLTAKEFFEEHGTSEVVVELKQLKILMIEKSLVHILFRHFAGAAKYLDTGKSFHMDKSISWKNLLYDLEVILKRVSEQIELTEKILEYLPIKFKGKVYLIHCLPVSKENKTEFRLETFYPVEFVKDIENIADNYKEKSIDELFSVFVHV